MAYGPKRPDPKETEPVVQTPLSDFLSRLASSEPTPGGGSVAALTGALSAGLAAMVCHLTIGKKKYAEHEAELTAVLARADSLRGTLTGLMTADIKAYEGLSAAYKLPKNDDAEAAARSAAIQDALVDATDVPLQIAEASAAVLDLVPVVVEKGSVVAVSDAGMAALLAIAALRSAALNVLINIGSTKDEARAAAAQARLETALGERVAAGEAVYLEVVERLKG